jgi:hypothetical protein
MSLMRNHKVCLERLRLPSSGVRVLLIEIGFYFLLALVFPQKIHDRAMGPYGPYFATVTVVP